MHACMHTAVILHASLGALSRFSLGSASFFSAAFWHHFSPASASLRPRFRVGLASALLRPRFGIGPLPPCFSLISDHFGRGSAIRTHVHEHAQHALAFAFWHHFFSAAFWHPFCARTCIPACTCIRTHVRTCIRTHVCTRTHAGMTASLYACMHTCMRACLHTYACMLAY